jgi:ER membrane protein complex subunit 1
MRFYARLLLTFLLVAEVFAVFQDEAFHTDYHYALLGPPKQDSTFFHRPQTTSGASLLYTLSEKLQIGAVNPKDGAIVWRHDLSEYTEGKGSEGFLRAKAGENVVVSGVGNHVSAWDAMDGRLVWDTKLDEGHTIKDLEVVDDASTSPTVVVLLGNEKGIVKTLDANTGEVKGEYFDER